MEDLDAVAINNEELLALLLRHRDGAVEPLVDTVVLELVDQTNNKPDKRSTPAVAQATGAIFVPLDKRTSRR